MNDVPIVLFGAFDRHNLGDFLLARAAALRAGTRACLFAGLRAVDLTAFGGFAVEPVQEICAGWRQRFGSAPLDLVHVGGEILDTDAWEAAVMLLDPDLAAAVTARLDRNTVGRKKWAAEFLGDASPAPYALDRVRFPGIASVEFRAVGGTGLAQRENLFRQAVVAAVVAADRLTVRDRSTQSALAAYGIRAGVEADPATTLGPWLADEIATVPRTGAYYIAVQFAAGFGDDATLEALVAVLDGLRQPVVLFRAGAAPWHDDTAVYERLLARLRVPARLMDSLHVRDICALIARSGLCLASSLHAVLVAGMFAVPAVGLERRPGEGSKLRAYAETWGGFEVQTPASLAVRPPRFRQERLAR